MNARIPTRRETDPYQDEPEGDAGRGCLLAFCIAAVFWIAVGLVLWGVGR